MNQNQDLDLSDIEVLQKVMALIYQGKSNQEIKLATQYLKAHSKKVESVPQFLQILDGSPEVGQRQLATILIKRNVAQHFLEMEDNDRNFLRENCLKRFYMEPQSLVRKSLAVLIAQLAKVGSENDRPWNSLFEEISSKADEKNEEGVRVMSIYLLRVLLEVAGEHFGHYHEDLAKFFIGNMKDKSWEIRKQTMMATLSLSLRVNDDNLAKEFTDVIPLCLQAFVEAIEQNDSDALEYAITSLYELTENKVIFFDNKNLTTLVETLCHEQSILSKKLSISIRESMFDILHNLAINFKKPIMKIDGLMNKIIETCFSLACIKEKDEDNPDAEPLNKAAVQFINQLAMLLPKKKSYPAYKKYVEQMFKSDDLEVVEAAFLIVGAVTEGCAEYVKRDLKFYIEQYIDNGLTHNSLEIRRATCYAINQFAQYLQPDILIWHSKIIPGLIKILEDKDPDGLTSAVITVEIFCLEMNESIVKYLEELLPKLIQIVDQDSTPLAAKRHAILSISSCAEAAEGKFVPYAKELIPLLGQLLNITDVQHLEIRAVATSCLASIVGHCIDDAPEVFNDLIAQYVPEILKGLKEIDHPILREFSFTFFFSMASFMGENFKDYMEELLRLANKAIDTIRAAALDKNENDDLEADSDEEGLENVMVNENLIEEMAAAIKCLGEIAKACPKQFAPYYKGAVEQLLKSTEHYHAQVRMQAMIGLQNIAIALAKAEGDGKVIPFKRGLPLQRKYNEDIEEFIFIIFYEKVLFLIEDDPNIDMVRGAVECIGELLIELGPGAVYQKLERIVEALELIFNNETTAQQKLYGEDDEEINGEILTSATELAEQIAKYCGDEFLPLFEKLMPLIVSFIGPDYPEDDVAQIVGVLGQCCKHMPTLAKKKGYEILQICSKVLEYNDEYINRNAAYCVAMVCESASELVSGIADKTLEELKYIHENSMFQDTKDNVVSAIARIAYNCADKIPFGMIFSNLMKEIPFYGDIKENRTMLKLIAFAFDRDPSLLQGHEEKCVDFIVMCFKERKQWKIKDETVWQAIVVMLKKLNQQEQGQQLIEKYAKEYLKEEQMKQFGELFN